MIKQTIALIGSDRFLGSALARQMAGKNQFRLLLVTENEKGLNPFESQVPEAEIEFIDCLKDGCWEADIIVIDKPLNAAADLAARIQEVATQKIIFLLPEADRATAFDQGRHWQSLLPNSKLVTGFTGSGEREIFLSGDEQDAVRSMAALMKDLGYRSIVQHKN